MLTTILSVMGGINTVIDLYKNVGVVVNGEGTDRLLDEMHKLREEVVQIKENIYFAPHLRGVSDTTHPSRALSDLRTVCQMLEPVQQAIGGKVVSSRLIITPDKMEVALKADPWDVLWDIRPFKLATQHTDPAMTPIMFVHDGRRYIGWQKRGVLPVMFNCEWHDLPGVRGSKPIITQQKVGAVRRRDELALAKELLRSVEEAAGRAALRLKNLNPSIDQIVATSPQRIEAALQNVCDAAVDGRVELPMFGGERNELWPALVSLIEERMRHFPNNAWFRKNPHAVKKVINIGAPRKPRRSEIGLTQCVMLYVRAWLEDGELSKGSDGKFRQPSLDLLLSPPKMVTIEFKSWEKNGDCKIECVTASNKLKNCMSDLYNEFTVSGAELGRDGFYICVLPLLNRYRNASAGVLVEAVRNLNKAMPNAKPIPVKEWLIDGSDDC